MTSICKTDVLGCSRVANTHSAPQLSVYSQYQDWTLEQWRRWPGLMNECLHTIHMAPGCTSGLDKFHCVMLTVYLYCYCYFLASYINPNWRLENTICMSFIHKECPSECGKSGKLKNIFAADPCFSTALLGFSICS